MKNNPTDNLKAATTDVALENKGTLTRLNEVLLGFALNFNLVNGDFDSALEYITKTAARELNVKRVGIWLFRNNSTIMRCEKMYDLGSKSFQSGQELEVARYPLFFKALKEKNFLSINNARSHPDTREFGENYFAPLGVTSVLDVPILAGGKLKGVLCYEHVGNSLRKWKEEEQNFALSMSYYLVMAIEAEKRKKAQLALERSEQRFKVLASMAPVPLIITVPEDGRILFANRKFEEEFGQPGENFVGKRMVDFLEDSSKRQDLIQAFNRDGYVKNFEVKVKKTSGATFWANVSVEKVHFDDREVYFKVLENIVKI